MTTQPFYVRVGGRAKKPVAVTPLVAVVDVVVVVAFAAAAILVDAIDAGGFLASFAVGYSILVGGGPSWFLITAVFFALGVGFTFYKYEMKKKLGMAQEKGGRRNWPNILANGGAGSIFAAAAYFQMSPLLAALFLGSLSTAAADTVATELGLLSDRTPRLITNPSKVVAPGTSGGVTSLGFIGALLASVVIGALALVLEVLPSGLWVLPICAVGGLVGAAADSLLGAVAQRKGHCAVCTKPTEALRHCGEPTVVTGGIPFLENNIVNLLSTFAGAAAAALAFLVL